MTRPTQRSTQSRSRSFVAATISAVTLAELLAAAGAAPSAGSAAAAGAPAATPASKVDLAARVLPQPAEPGRTVTPYIKYPHGKIALVHVRVIDGTGAPPASDQTVLIDGDRIAAIGPSVAAAATASAAATTSATATTSAAATASAAATTSAAPTASASAAAAAPAGYRVIEAGGMSVFPGIVGMHEHQFYAPTSFRPSGIRGEPPLVSPEVAFSAPRMYLAGGVTTLRTAGSLEPYTDLNLKQQIDSGAFPGPHMDVTGPYLEGPGSYFVQMHPLRDAADAARTVSFWADQGASSFKAYMNFSRAELKAAIDAAHARHQGGRPPMLGDVSGSCKPGDR